MSLEAWGWTPTLAKAFAPWDKSRHIPARVIRGEKNYYRVMSPQGELTVRFAGKIRHRAGGRPDLPVVGDWVVVAPQPRQRGTIVALLERRNSFSRNLPGRRKSKEQRAKEQVIAANIDLVMIVSGLDQDYNLRRIERYLTLVSSSGAAALLVLNKADLHPQPQECVAAVKAIAGNTPILLCSALEPLQLLPLQKYINEGQTVALLGSSGVGKSTIVNALLEEERQKIAPVSSADGRGRHTTTHRELFIMPQGGILMDNPGMRELHLWGEGVDLEESFADIDTLARDCRFRDCSHAREPGCAVREAVAAGAIDGDRLANYHKLKTELEALQKPRH